MRNVATDEILAKFAPSMKNKFLSSALRVLVMLVVICLLVWGGAQYWRSLDSRHRYVTALDLVTKARASIGRGDHADAVFLAGSASALSQDPLVLLGAADVLTDAHQPGLAQELLGRAKTSATESDPKLLPAIEEQIKKTGIMSSRK